MANRYGEAALMAVRMESYGKALSPLERWQDAIQKLYPTSRTSQKKAGPRAAFLGLCEAGLVKVIAGGQSSSGNRDKDYALQAVELLKAGSHTSTSQLWQAVTDESAIAHSSQMDVVLALWKNGLIVA